MQACVENLIVVEEHALIYERSGLLVKHSVTMAYLEYGVRLWERHTT